MVYLFLDTNSFLEFQPFESIKWAEVCGEPEFAIVIAPIVIRELNKYKDNTRGKKRERARKARKRINEIIRGTNPSKLNVQICKNPSKNAFEHPDFHKDIADDWLIFSAYEFDEGNNRKVIVSNDTGIFIIAQQFGINSIEIPDKYLVPPEPTEEETKIKELQRRLAEYESALPNVSLSFGKGKTHMELNKAIAPNFAERITKYKDELAKKYTHKYKKPENPILPLNIPDILYSDKDYDRYNALIEPYIKDESWNMATRDMFEYINSCIIPLKFELNNCGAIPSGLLGIQIKFSHNAKILSREESRNTFKLRKTEEPVLQSSHIPTIPPINLSAFTPGAFFIPPQENNDTIYSWDIETPIDVSKPFFFDHDPVIQNMPPKIFAKNQFYVFLCYSQEFEIYWEIADSKLPHKIKGTLSVSIK